MCPEISNDNRLFCYKLGYRKTGFILATLAFAAFLDSRCKTIKTTFQAQSELTDLKTVFTPKFGR